MRYGVPGGPFNLSSCPRIPGSLTVELIAMIQIEKEGR
jgi:hypothetical protein